MYFLQTLEALQWILVIKGKLIFKSTIHNQRYSVAIFSTLCLHK